MDPLSQFYFDISYTSKYIILMDTLSQFMFFIVDSNA